MDYGLDTGMWWCGIHRYHTTLMMKDAQTGGSFSWHQDYGSMGKQNIVVWTMVWILVGDGVVYIAVCASLPHQADDEGRSDRRQLFMSPGLWVSRTLWYGPWCGYW